MELIGALPAGGCSEVNATLSYVNRLQFNTILFSKKHHGFSIRFAHLFHFELILSKAKSRKVFKIFLLFLLVASSEKGKFFNEALARLKSDTRPV